MLLLEQKDYLKNKNKKCFLEIQFLEEKNFRFGRNIEAADLQAQLLQNHLMGRVTKHGNRELSWLIKELKPQTQRETGKE